MSRGRASTNQTFFAGEAPTLEESVASHIGFPVVRTDGRDYQNFVDGWVTKFS